MIDEGRCGQDKEHYEIHLSPSMSYGVFPYILAQFGIEDVGKSHERPTRQGQTWFGTNGFTILLDCPCDQVEQDE